MGKEKIGGTSRAGASDETNHQNYKDHLSSSGDIVLPDIEVDFKKSTTGETEVTYDKTLLKERYGENPSRVNESAYTKSSINKIDTNSAAIENIMDKSSVIKRFNKSVKPKDTLSK